MKNALTNLYIHRQFEIYSLYYYIYLHVHKYFGIPKVELLGNGAMDGLKT